MRGGGASCPGDASPRRQKAVARAVAASWAAVEAGALRPGGEQDRVRVFFRTQKHCVSLGAGMSRSLPKRVDTNHNIIFAGGLSLLQPGRPFPPELFHAADSSLKRPYVARTVRVAAHGWMRRHKWHAAHAWTSRHKWPSPQMPLCRRHYGCIRLGQTAGVPDAGQQELEAAGNFPGRAPAFEGIRTEFAFQSQCLRGETFFFSQCLHGE